METETVGYGPSAGAILAFFAVSEAEFGCAGARDGMQGVGGELLGR